jgi:hypothetical protein
MPEMQIAEGHRWSVICEWTQHAARYGFRSEGTKWYKFSLEGGAELKSEAFACQDCGIVWTTVAYPENLREIITRSTKAQ